LSFDANGKYTVTEKTEIAYDMESTMKMVIRCHSVVRNTADICSDYKGPKIFIDYEPVWSSYKRMKDRGVKIKFIIDVREDNVEYCKRLSEVGEIRHLEGFNGNFGILDKIDYVAPAISQSHEPTVPILIRISIKEFVDPHQDLFNALWKNAIPLEQKINEIEKGIKPEKIETITDPSEIETKYIQILEKATEEILLIFPTLNSTRRQFHIGVFDVLKKNMDKHNNLKIRILFPSSASIFQSSSSSSSKETSKEKTYSDFELDYISIYKNNVSIRNTEPSISTKSTILVIDKKESLVIEVKNDLKEAFSESMGFGTYSNSTATVLSYVSIFESFWSYSDIVEKLKRSEELQKDFVQMAAHELKNPIQPILGLSNLLMKYKPSDEKEFHNIVKSINRNAKKLIQLTNDILDITKIETNNLNLNKELFNMGDLISDIIEDYKDQLDNENVKLASKFIYSSKPDEKKEGEDGENKNKYNISVFADRTRITQVISNLLNNAIKFTNRGFIDIVIEKKYAENKVNISVKDTGCGIDQIILPKLFSKFATKSKGGTGLGLYISKNIIDAHGGQIYANNNKDDKGSTFGFSLSLIK
jgi:two-component system, OmpR family, sensor histidine kinase VicK